MEPMDRDPIPGQDISSSITMSIMVVRTPTTQAYKHTGMRRKHNSDPLFAVSYIVDTAKEGEKSQTSTFSETRQSLIILDLCLRKTGA